MWASRTIRALVTSAALAAFLAAGRPAAEGEPLQGDARPLIKRVIARQHANDTALVEYERRERVTRRKRAGDANAEVKLYRVVPTGTGTLKLLLEEDGRAVKPEFYAKELRQLVKALEEALQPQDPLQRGRIEKWERRKAERRERLDAAPIAFRAAVMGRENRGGRTLVKLQLEADPGFVPQSRATEPLATARATVWVEESAGQAARLEAELVRDLSFGGGVLGKVYRGARVVVEQAEVAPGVWLPMHYEFDYAGRRFIFPFEVHEVIEIRDYRRIGPPREALAAVRAELNKPGVARAAP